jgi:hypothetical protein
VVVLGVDPLVDVVGAVEDAAAEADAAGSGAEVAPIAQGGDGCAEQVGGVGDGEKVVLVLVPVRLGWISSGIVDKSSTRSCGFVTQ